MSDLIEVDEFEPGTEVCTVWLFSVKWTKKKRKRRVSVNLTPLQTAKFLQKWADEHNVEVIISYNFVGAKYEMTMMLSRVNLEFTDTGDDVGMTLNHIATKALLRLVELDEVTFTDMPNNIISVLRYESKMK